MKRVAALLALCSLAAAARAEVLTGSPGVAQGGDVTANTVTVAGSTVARTNGARATDRFNAPDYPGIDRSGATDDAPGLQALQNRVQAVGSGLVTLPSGNYLLGGVVYSVPGVTWQIEGSANVHGSALVGCTDGSVIAGNAGIAWCKTQNGGGAETTIHASALVQGQTNTVSTEKIAAYARVQNNDPSVYSGTAFNHDGVAFEGQAIMGSTSGRIWSYDALVSVPPGMDGFASGYEVDIYNNGVPGVLDQPNAKIGFDPVCSGPNNCTLAYLISSVAPAVWQDGIVVRSSSIAVGGDALAIRPTGGTSYDIAAIRGDGSALFTKATIAGHVSNTGPAPSVSGCGNGAAITARSSDHRGSVTIGSGGPTGCTVVWQAPYPQAAPPFCVAGTNVPNVNVGALAASSALTLTLPASPPSLVVSWVCEG